MWIFIFLVFFTGLDYTHRTSLHRRRRRWWHFIGQDFFLSAVNATSPENQWLPLSPLIEDKSWLALHDRSAEHCGALRNTKQITLSLDRGTHHKLFSQNIVFYRATRFHQMTEATAATVNRNCGEKVEDIKLIISLHTYFIAIFYSWIQIIRVRSNKQSIYCNFSGLILYMQSVIYMMTRLLGFYGSSTEFAAVQECWRIKPISIDCLTIDRNSTKS